MPDEAGKLFILVILNIKRKSDVTLEKIGELDDRFGLGF